VKPNINSIEVHPQLSHNKHLMDGTLVGDGSLQPNIGPTNYLFLHGVHAFSIGKLFNWVENV
jgi:hypothetical protein